jgi:hypothetical protein
VWEPVLRRSVSFSKVSRAAEVESIFREALRRAQSSGELSRKQDPATLARFFVVTIPGMWALARLKSDRRALEEVAGVALAVLD